MYGLNLNPFMMLICCRNALMLLAFVYYSTPLAFNEEME